MASSPQGENPNKVSLVGHVFVFVNWYDTTSNVFLTCFYSFISFVNMDLEIHFTSRFIHEHMQRCKMPVFRLYAGLTEAGRYTIILPAFPAMPLYSFLCQSHSHLQNHEDHDDTINQKFFFYHRCPTQKPYSGGT